MALEYYARAIVGLRIAANKLTEKKLTRACSCAVQYDEKNPPNFCSNCGGSFMGESLCHINGYDGRSIGDFPVIPSDGYFYIGFFIDAKSVDNAFKVLPGSFKKDIYDTVMRYAPDLWDEEKFGLYAILEHEYCSQHC
jgi:hypothetical protein